MNQLVESLSLAGFSVSALHCDLVKHRNAWQSDPHNSVPVSRKVEKKKCAHELIILIEQIVSCYGSLIY